MATLSFARKARAYFIAVSQQCIRELIATQVSHLSVKTRRADASFFKEAMKDVQDADHEREAEKQEKLLAKMHFAPDLVDRINRFSNFQERA